MKLKNSTCFLNGRGAIMVLLKKRNPSLTHSSYVLQVKIVLSIIIVSLKYMFALRVACSDCST